MIITGCIYLLLKLCRNYTLILNQTIYMTSAHRPKMNILGRTPVMDQDTTGDISPSENPVQLFFFFFLILFNFFLFIYLFIYFCFF